MDTQITFQNLNSGPLHDEVFVLNGQHLGVESAASDWVIFRTGTINEDGDFEETDGTPPVLMTEQSQLDELRIYRRDFGPQNLAIHVFQDLTTGNIYTSDLPLADGSRKVCTLDLVLEADDLTVKPTDLSVNPTDLTIVPTVDFIPGESHRVPSGTWTPSTERQYDFVISNGG